ncbi:hypothetical protein QNO00_12735 [Arthrobacter sp. zg-Y1219]|uniref:hypothetical protein n=1 Tax=Arthrobacter sp. zg-Y1219 TaxID=3049067 RepID=UPI0024C3D7C7|nr:hypothetical protein [Arthrobacter sp. zg-Y1219]MDK1361126.1 hypothetical protein [Arthrobacter sp. zg-Y1219]
MSEPGRRLRQHANAINAAKTAGVRHLIYTSAIEAPTTILRNGWYTDNHRQEFESARQNGVIANSVGAGRIATAPRRDFADAATVVLSTPGHEGKAYELSGDAAWDYTEFAAAGELSKLIGRPTEPLLETLRSSV